MKIYYVDKDGNIKNFVSQLEFPTPMSSFVQSLSSEFADMSVVVNQEVVKNKDFQITDRHEVWLLPRTSCDVKQWRVSRVTGPTRT